MKKINLVIGCLVALALACLPVMSATIKGTVQDARGGLIQNVKINLMPADGPTLTQTTNQQGEFVFDQLAAGSYRIVASAPGFGSKTLPVADVAVHETRDFVLALELSAMPEPVDGIQADIDLNKRLWALALGKESGTGFLPVRTGGTPVPLFQFTFPAAPTAPTAAPVRPKKAEADFDEAYRFFVQVRAYPNKEVDWSAYDRAIQPRAAMGAARLSSGGATDTPSWEFIGPRNLDVPYRQYYGEGPVSGRVNAVAFDPKTPDTYYAGTAGGGV